MLACTRPAQDQGSQHSSMEGEPQKPLSEPLTDEAFCKRQRPGPTLSKWAAKMYSEDTKSRESERQVWEELGGGVLGEHNKKYTICTHEILKE